MKQDSNEAVYLRCFHIGMNACSQHKGANPSQDPSLYHFIDPLNLKEEEILSCREAWGLGWFSSSFDLTGIEENYSKIRSFCEKRLEEKAAEAEKGFRDWHESLFGRKK